MNQLKYQIGEKVKFRYNSTKINTQGHIIEEDSPDLIFTVKQHQELHDLHGSSFYRYIVAYPNSSNFITMVHENDLISLTEIRQEKIYNFIKKAD